MSLDTETACELHGNTAEFYLRKVLYLMRLIDYQATCLRIVVKEAVLAIEP